MTKIEDRELALKKRLTDEFLDTLVEAGRVIGWGVDYWEVKDFINSCFDIAEKDLPSENDLIPYE